VFSALPVGGGFIWLRILHFSLCFKQMALKTVSLNCDSPHLPLVHTFAAIEKLLVSSPLYYLSPWPMNIIDAINAIGGLIYLVIAAINNLIFLSAILATNGTINLIE